MKQIIRYFMKGLLFLVPVFVTIYVIYWVFSTIDNFVHDLFKEYFEESRWIIGFGVVLTLVVITLVGFLCSLFITRPIMQFLEKSFSRLPLIKLLYSSIKDLIEAFVGEKKKFDQPVMVQLIPGSELKSLGFVTRKSLEMFGLDDMVAVYFPQSYNFAGSVLLVPKEQVVPLDMESSEVMAFIVSGGVSGGPHPETKPEKEYTCLPGW
jgi:uncharacterized membrane protein